jgi:hypothetical protein
MFIADETGNLFFHQRFGLREQEITQNSHPKRGNKKLFLPFTIRCPP